MARIFVLSIVCVNCMDRHADIEDATFRGVNRYLDSWADSIPCCPRCASHQVSIETYTEDVHHGA